MASKNVSVYDGGAVQLYDTDIRNAFAFVKNSAGNIVVQTASSGGSLLLGGTGVVTNLRFAENSSITGGGSKVIALGQSGDTFNMNVSGVTYNLGTVSGNPTFSGNVTIQGILTVGGTATINSTTLTVADKNIELAYTISPSDALADGGGITLRGTTDKTIIWDNINHNWTLNQHVNIPNGYKYKINNVIIADSTNVYLNASTVTNGLYSSSSYSNPSWLTSVDWSKLASKPTTLSGYGITDAVNTSKFQFPSSVSTNLRTINQEGIYFTEAQNTSTNQPVTSTAGAFFQLTDAGGTDVKFQLWGHNDGNSLYYQVQWGSGTWRGWKKIWSEANDGPDSGLDADLWDGNQFASYLNQAVLTTSNVTYATVTASNLKDANGSWNVNLGSGGSEGRGLVAGYSGGAYGGIGYNIRHTATGGQYIAPGGDSTSYISFDSGFTFYYNAAGTAGRTLNLGTELVRIGRFNADGTLNITTQASSSLHAVRADRTIQIQGTTNQININNSAAMDLTANRSWTLSLPQNIHTAASPTFAGLTINGNVTITGSLNSGSACFKERVVLATYLNAGTAQTIPNSKTYTIGSGKLMVFVNGDLQDLGDDYTEFSSSSIKFTYNLPINAKIIFYNLL